MRDPDRIPLVLGMLERKWEENPDLRLGQLLVNLVRRESKTESGAEVTHLFNIQDESLAQLLGPQTDIEQEFADSSSAGKTKLN